jgi:N-acetylglutamate synthase-like GNAT family acetyltransferase
MSVIIRKMHPDDYGSVIQLLSRWNIAPLSPSRDVLEPERQELIVENAHVAVDGDRIVGVVSFFQLSADVGEGASFVLDPEYMGQRIAERLGDESRREMYSRGIRRTRTEADRPEAIRWLLKRGHRIVGTVPKRHAFGAPDVDHWTLFELELEPPDEMSEQGDGSLAPVRPGR